MSELDETRYAFYRLIRDKREQEGFALLDKFPEIVTCDLLLNCVTTFSVDIVANLLERNVDINCFRKGGSTALCDACGSGRVEMVRFLLENGADPNPVSCTPISSIVDFEIDRKPGRFEILKLMLEYGADINKEIPTLPGENLYTKAEEYMDLELLEMIKQHGGKPTQAWLDAMAQPEIVLDIETFEDRLVDALRKGWTRAIKSRRKETFFMFGLETDDDWVVLTPYCNTEELVAKENTDVADCPAAKWAVDPDFELYGAGEEFTESLSTELNSVFYLKESATAFEKRQRQIKKIFENALRRLDAEGLFEKSQPRERVLVGISFMDADVRGEKEMLRIFKRLNPPASLKPYLDAMKRR